MLKHEQATKTRRMDRKPEINYRKKFKYYRQIIEPTWLSFNKYVKCNQKKKKKNIHTRRRWLLVGLIKTHRSEFEKLSATEPLQLPVRGQRNWMLDFLKCSINILKSSASFILHNTITFALHTNQHYFIQIKLRQCNVEDWSDLVGLQLLRAQPRVTKEDS